MLKDCKACALYKVRKNIVPDYIPKGAKIAFIARNPGRDEDLQGIEPLVGRAGKLFTFYLQKYSNIKRKNVALINRVKCFTPDNRQPTEEEIKACNKHFINSLRLALKTVRLIIPMGNIACQAVLKRAKQEGITSLRGRIFVNKTTLIMPIYHPSAVLRLPSKYSKEYKEDFIKIRRIYNGLK